MFKDLKHACNNRSDLQVVKHYAGFIYADKLEGLSKVLNKDLPEPAVSGCKKYASLAKKCPKFALSILCRVMNTLDPKFIYQGIPFWTANIKFCAIHLQIAMHRFQSPTTLSIC